ncbi:complex I subunit 5 family protein [Qiania dongpingensis]|uniref:Sodium:proton antiporter n=1 Tax=Qiania dongpingensis TaxID=2763669 RepID=A0A7G9G3V8_9FIRM|nr:proton-conducting transporter membrane subunit [Qiania dongpingensis]QNM05490.1 sodium:proton antiporter [Qiania dongpingensis]
MSGDWILLVLVVWPMLGAFLSYGIGRRGKNGRNLFADGVVIAEFALLCGLLVRGLLSGNGGVSGMALPELNFKWEGFCGLGLTLRLDGFRVLYGLVAAFMWMTTTVFSREYFGHYRNRNRYYLFLLLTLGATMGVFLSADLYTTFIFFEIMSFTSYVWVAHDEKEAAMRAAGTYLGVAVIGGMVMLMGLFMLYHTAGTLQMDELLEACRQVRPEKSGVLYLSGALMLFGFGAKAGMFPLHIWLPKAHPVAPAPASALLSGILTKSGIFGILVVSCNIFLHDSAWGMAVLLLGVVTMLGGAALAVFSVDLKRTLACSSMSQIGFILVGIGMQGLLGEENALAVRGTLLHMVNHSLFKLVLFMAAGVVYMNLHKLDLNEIRGFGRKKPLLKFCFLMGGLGIGGIPLWSGYVSKTLLHESIVEYTALTLQAKAGMAVIGSPAFFKTVEWLFLLAGGMTVAYMLKLFIAVFVEKHPEKQDEFDREYKKYWNLESRLAVTIPALLLPVMGTLPSIIMNKIAELGQPFMRGENPLHAVHYFSFENLKGGMISIGIGLALYFGVIRTCLMRKRKDGIREYVDRWPAFLDLEERIYRPVLLRFFPWFFGGICGFLDKYVISGIQGAFLGISGAVCQFLDTYVVETAVKVFMTVTAFGSRALDHMTDGIIVLARRTTHRQVKRPKKKVMRDRFAYAMGHFLDGCADLLNKTVRKKHPIRKSYVPNLIELEEETVRTNRIINGSLSFALMLVCIGLILVLLYLLWQR